MTTNTADVNVVATVKGPERYVFVYRPGDECMVMEIMGRWAADAELDFTWRDAADLSLRVRKLLKEQADE